MTINRRGALGAMIGGVTAGPSLVESTLKIQKVAPPSVRRIGDDVALTATAHPTPEPDWAMLKRVASGDFSDEDFEAARWWVGRYHLTGRSVPRDPFADVGYLRSVSAAARRVITNDRQYRQEREATIAEVVRHLLSVS